MHSAFLTFRMGAESQALPLSCVDRAVRAAAITSLPSAPPFVLGVLDVEGEVLPVLSIRRRFGRSQPEIAPESHFLVARMGARRVVLPVEEVLAVVELPRFTEGAAVAPGLEPLKGVARLDDGLVIIHDLEQFFSPEEWRAIDRCVPQGS